MNDLQTKALNLLQIFVGICEKWDIDYYLVCGSALGAAKYQGFIPWDDDIDVGLLRPEYERFLEVAQKELPDWCFLQNYRTEPQYPHLFSKLRDSNTTFIETGDSHLLIHHGIYMDIFPIDGYPTGKVREKVFLLRHKLYAWVRFSVLKGNPKRKVRIRNRVLLLLGADKKIAKVQAKAEKMYKKYPPQTSELWCNYGNWQGEKEYAPRWHYGNGTWAVFEGLRVRIPENYDAYLTQKYGEWRKDPPREKQCSHHIGLVCDTEKPYTNYINP